MIPFLCSKVGTIGDLRRRKKIKKFSMFSVDLKQLVLFFVFCTSLEFKEVTIKAGIVVC
jgi:metal-dependent HD superfamily phosphatase/phosphodiesterase